MEGPWIETDQVRHKGKSCKQKTSGCSDKMRASLPGRYVLGHKQLGLKTAAHGPSWERCVSQRQADFFMETINMRCVMASYGGCQLLQNFNVGSGNCVTSRSNVFQV